MTTIMSQYRDARRRVGRCRRISAVDGGRRPHSQPHADVPVRDGFWGCWARSRIMSSAEVADLVRCEQVADVLRDMHSAVGVFGI